MHARLEASHRLFFALWPGDEVRAAMAQRAQAMESECAPGGRPTAPARYHMTLRFLGSFRPLPEAVIDRAIAAADTLQMPAFELALDHAGRFERSRVWWLGCAPSPELQSLHERLGAALASRGLHPESTPFAPHVTIGRNPRQWRQPRAFEPLRWPVHAFVLVDSAAGAPAYRIVRRWPLEPVSRGW